MNEERWHNFAKEKPSEDMEGRNFIVSNGHYEKIATWCGYWENEPFMGDHLCDEVVRWKGYLTPEEEKANETTHTELKPMKCDELKEYKAYEFGTSYVYHIGEVKEAIAELKARIQLDDDEMTGFLQLEEECGGGDLRNYIAELKQKLAEKDKEIARQNTEIIEAVKTMKSQEEEIVQLKRKLENVYASMYADVVDANMENRRLRRALWVTRANMARGLAEMCEHQIDSCGVSRSRFLVGWDKKSKPKRMTTTEWGELWRKVEQKCRAKAEEYK